MHNLRVYMCIMIMSGKNANGLRQSFSEVASVYLRRRIPVCV